TATASRVKRALVQNRAFPRAICYVPIVGDRWIPHCLHSSTRARARTGRGGLILSRRDRRPRFTPGATSRRSRSAPTSQALPRARRPRRSSREITRLSEALQQRSREFCASRGYSAGTLLWWSSYFRRNG